MTMAVHSTTTTTALTSSETVLGCRIATTIQGEGLRARVGRVGGERLTLSPSLLAGDCGPSAPPTVNLLNTWPSAPQMTRSTPPPKKKQKLEHPSFYFLFFQTCLGIKHQSGFMSR